MVASLSRLFVGFVVCPRLADESEIGCVGDVTAVCLESDVWMVVWQDNRTLSPTSGTVGGCRAPSDEQGRRRRGSCLGAPGFVG